MNARDRLNEIITFGTKWEKVLGSLPAGKQESMIRRMAYGINKIDYPHIVKGPPKYRFIKGGRELSGSLSDPVMDIPETTKNLKSAMKSARTKSERRTSTAQEQLGRRKEALGYKKRKPYDKPLPAGVDPEEEVEIVHGGGAQYLDNWTKGRAPGYPLEAGGSGIQVHRVHESGATQEIESRTGEYARRASAGRFDQPAKLTGLVKRKHLTAAQNDYENGVVSPEHITRMKIERLSARDRLNEIIEFGQAQNVVYQALKSSEGRAQHLQRLRLKR